MSQTAVELNPYVNFNGNCAEAFKFYERVLGGKIVMTQTFGESPMKDQTPPDWHGKVVHTRLEVGKFALMGSDAPPGYFTPPQGAQISISVASVPEGERIFNALAENGKVKMPFAKTFWSPGFGMTVDRFGVPWMVNSAEA
jgi:PhnB protein